MLNFLLIFALSFCWLAIGWALHAWIFGSNRALTKSDLKETEKHIMSALTDEFQQIKDNILEGTTELTAKITALEASIGTDTLSPESRAILDDVKAAAATLASIVPNAPTTPA